MKSLEIYTDGACSGNPGKGGFGVVIIYKGVVKEYSGFFSETTNNRMELYAVIFALKQLKETCEVKLYSDSAYVCNAFNLGWIKLWQQNNFKNSKKEQVKNLDLWHELIELTEKHKVSFIKVKGHADNEYNNRCDFLATNEIKKA